MQSRITKKILERAKPVANTRQHIIIVGEYGSGKKWLADHIHKASNRGNSPFIAVNCYTLAQDQAQKKIFGYLKFSDESVTINKGSFEKSNKGTLFLEGFDSFSEHLQKKILNAIENRQSHHIGSTNKFPIDVRIILSMDVESFYNSQRKLDLLSNTLNIEPYTINYPPLRQRREEIDEMVRNFLEGDFSKRYDFAATGISPRALHLCIRYDWPGNVQQLKNAIEHASIISEGETIQAEHLPKSVQKGQPTQDELNYLEHTYTYQTAERRLFRQIITKKASIPKLAEILDLSTQEVEQKLKKYELKPEVT